MNRRRTPWLDLPAALRALIQAHTGPVGHTEEPDAGRHSDFAASLYSPHRVPLAFVKGSNRKRTSLSRELLVGPHLSSLQAPQVLWNVESDGWTAAGFEHIDGRHADFTNPFDLQLLAEALAQTTTAPDELPSITTSWRPVWEDVITSENPLPPDMEPDQRLVDKEIEAFAAMRGDTLTHTDINPYNVLIGSAAWIVDWAWAASAAPWVDSVLTVPRLMSAGHDLSAAEQWAATIPGYSKANERELAAFAVANLGRMVWLSHAGRDVRPHQIRTVQRWANHRLDVLGEPPL